MIQSDSQIIAEVTTFNKILGTPSSQLIIELLVCWDHLAVKDIIEKSQFSESQIHTTLQNLEKAGLVQKKSRGIYSLSDSQFAISLRDAYRVKLEQIVGKQLYYISDNLETLPLEELYTMWQQLVDLWQPILSKNFSAKAGQIAGHIMER